MDFVVKTGIALLLLNVVLFIIYHIALQIFWKEHLWFREHFSFFKKYYLGSWDTTNDSARFRHDIAWWGYNARTHSWFYIWNNSKYLIQFDNCLTAKWKWLPKLSWIDSEKMKIPRVPGILQRLALNIGEPAGPNTWYGPDIGYPFNRNVSLSSNVSIALGAMRWSHLLNVWRYSNGGVIPRDWIQIFTDVLQHPTLRRLAQQFSRSSASNKVRSDAEVTTVAWNCECDHEGCYSKVVLSLIVANELAQNDLIVIVDGCKNGPSVVDELVERRDGYSVYKTKSAV